MKHFFQKFFTSSSINNFAYAFSMSYPTPASLNYFFNFGFVSLVFLIIQIVTGIFLAMHYNPDVDYAFESVELIMRDVPNGALIRYAHSNGASFFFICVYLHILKGLYYASYSWPRHTLWFSGIIIYVLMVIIAFLGYVLPWGQMSYWAATVITNVVTVIPFFGQDILIWLWGGYSVSAPTLHRFFSFHYLLPFILLAIVCIHLIILHRIGSNAPSGLINKSDAKAFTPYFMSKDITFLLLVMMVFVSFVCFWPNYLGHPDNYIEANPLVTPKHIVPEWYFLPLYAILRAFPNKFFGVFFLIASILILFVLPFIMALARRSSRFSILREISFWFYLFTNVVLGYLGSQPLESAFKDLSQVLVIFYFFYFLFFLPFIILLENYESNLFVSLFLNLKKLNFRNKETKKNDLLSKENSDILLKSDKVKSINKNSNDIKNYYNE